VATIGSVDEVEPQEPEAANRGVAGTELGILDEIEAGLAEVQSALNRLDDGTYGTCERCSAPIEDETLERSPTARLCARHLPLAPSY
jgi:DnaK suppressor protein